MLHPTWFPPSLVLRVPSTPADFVVPPTDFNAAQLQQQVGVDVHRAHEEAEWQERQLRQARGMGMLSWWLLFGGVAVAMVGAALLSDRLARRYRQQQQQERAKACRQKWRAEKLRQWEAGELRQRVLELESKRARAQRQLDALAAYQWLDRWLPPPRDRDKPGHQWLMFLDQAECEWNLSKAEDALWSARLEEAVWRAEAVRRGGQGGSGDAAAQCSGQGGSGDASGDKRRRGQHGGSSDAPGDKRRPAQRGRRNAAEPFLRAVHAFVRGVLRRKQVVQFT